MVLVQMLYMDLRNLSRKTGLPIPRLSRQQQEDLSVLFLTAYSEAVAYDEKMKLLDGVDSE